MEKKGKLELTWVGKYEEEKLEPRILIEDKSKSYGESNTENMLIHGDNLLALKALEMNYRGRKCLDFIKMEDVLLFDDFIRKTKRLQ